MRTSGVSGASSDGQSSGNQKVDLAAVAAAKALRVQREQADAMVSLIAQASGSPDIGRIISVRA